MRLFLYSFLILFFEFTFIRYIPAHVKATAYFANLTIIATFLGMGLGILLSRKTHRVWLPAAFPLFVLALICTVYFFSNFFIEPFAAKEEFFWPASQIHNVHVRVIGIFWVITIFFVLTAACFLPLGWGLGTEFPKYRPLVAYSLDILGSIAGVVVFGISSALCLPPFLWILCGGAAFCFLHRGKRAQLLWAAALMLISACLTYMEDHGRLTTWSPYYKITQPAKKGPWGPVYVNDSFHQVMVDMRILEQDLPPFFRHFVKDYHLPYRRIASMKEVLILGAGTGNDVSVALLHGAEHVDAVEIDPVILSIGVRAHPNRPYQDRRVNWHNTDARVFLKNCARQYDLIVYATLDSHTVLAGQSNIRLDNYLYTTEAMRDVRRLLKPDGIFLLQFLALEDYIATKLYDLVRTVFGQGPEVFFFPEYRHFNHAILVKSTAEGGEQSSQPSPLIHSGSYRLPTDNWPFLYLREPAVPRHYLQILLVILAVSFFGVWGVVGKTFFRDVRPVMFFLGAGFLLLETKSITEFSLLFGSTWTVNLFVILAILTVILLANLLLLRAPDLSRSFLFAGLFSGLAFCYAIPVRQLLAESPFLRDVLTMVFTGIPIFFAACLFASCFQRELDAPAALGWNLLGAVAGGVLEYSGMGMGIKALYFLAMILYGAAAIGIRFQHGGLLRVKAG